MLIPYSNIVTKLTNYFIHAFIFESINFLKNKRLLIHNYVNDSKSYQYHDSY
jgi:hypothetical protein